MPFYEYECSACKFYVEALQKISDPPLKQCPSCKKQSLKKLVSAPVFRLKGGGWYETDFKSSDEQKRNLVGEEKDAATTETKPESKEAEKPAESKPTTDAKPEKTEKKATSVAVKKGSTKSAPKKKSKPPVKKK
jgi:putative FmdB family regulatory protein